MAEGEAARPEFDAVGTAKMLLRTVRSGALATIEAETGTPFGSLVTVATDCDGTPLILLSRLSAHTSNLDRDCRASILLAATGKGDPLAHPRLTVLGRMEPADGQRIRRRFLSRHPKAALYVDFPDFGFRRLVVESAHLNGGFARAARLTAAELTVPTPSALLDGEEGAIEHMNADHSDALALYATRLAGAPAGHWQASGIDPEGIDLTAGDLTARVTFPRPVGDMAELRRVLVDLAAQARGQTV